MIRVAKNLNVKKFSVREKRSRGWRVARYVDSIVLTNVQFVIYETERQRILREKKKRLCAYVQGIESTEMVDKTREITYNPYKRPFFYWKSNGRKVKDGITVIMRDGKVYG